MVMYHNNSLPIYPYNNKKGDLPMLPTALPREKVTLPKGG